MGALRYYKRSKSDKHHNEDEPGPSAKGHLRRESVVLGTPQSLLTCHRKTEPLRDFRDVNPKREECKILSIGVVV